MKIDLAPRIVLLLLALAGCVACQRQPTGRTDDRPGFIAYVPANASAKAPLVVALSPGGDAASMIKVWKPIADQRGWIIAASKQFRNGIEWDVVFDQLNATLDELLRDYPADSKRVVMMGLSGGAMASHAYAQVTPGRVRAVIANCGMIEEEWMREPYPRDGLVAFVASPTDFRFSAMQRDRAFLNSKGWTSTWIEFPGGHVLAPTTALDQAAAWLEKKW